MDPLSLLMILVLVGLGVFLFRRSRSKNKVSEARIKEIQAWYDTNVLLAKDPDTDQLVLRGFLAMENPHDEMFFARLGVLRALSLNPSLPVELQAAAINRVSQEESAARIDKSLKALAKSAGGVRGFMGFSTEI